jgi:16S rRNA (guanine527-N7)-methyltransferase
MAMTIALRVGEVQELLKPFYPLADGAVSASVLAYCDLLFRWNAKVNLTAVRSPTETVTRHFGESFFAASVIPMDRGTLVDVGSGAGFPGLALKLIRPDLHVILLETNRKKCAFLAEVTRSLKMQNVQIISSRAGDTQFEPDPADFITVRAVSMTDKLLRWSAKTLSNEGRLLAWLGARNADLVSENSEWDVERRAKIPHSHESFVVVLRKTLRPS